MGNQNNILYPSDITELTERRRQTETSKTLSLPIRTIVENLKELARQINEMPEKEKRIAVVTCIGIYILSYTLLFFIPFPTASTGSLLVVRKITNKGKKEKTASY